MAYNLLESIEKRIDKIRELTGDHAEGYHNVEGAALALTVLHDTAGGSHPLMKVLHRAIEKSDWVTARAGANSTIELFDQGALASSQLDVGHGADLIDEDVCTKEQFVVIDPLIIDVAAAAVPPPTGGGCGSSSGSVR